MPVDNSLPDVKNPVQLKTGQKPNNNFINNLDAVNVKLINSPTRQELLNYIPEFVSGTWEDHPKTEFSDTEREKVLVDLFDGKLLPTAMETIGLTFLIEGMDLIDVTHLIRHRVMSFASQATGDRDMRDDDILVKPSIKQSKYYERYKKIVEDSMNLYSEMFDDPDMPILDPRTILPRCTSNYYYARINIKEALMFIRKRKDEQIEPESMNIIALKMWIAILEVYPEIKRLVDVREQDSFYIHTASSGRNSNYYPPCKKNDTFNWKPEWFIKKKQRDEMIGAHDYEYIRDQLLLKIDSM